MTRTRRPSSQTVKVLSELATRPSEWRHGYELGLEVGLRSGSLYPILVRLSDRGLLESQWETDLTQGRPPRHLYRLTGLGLEYARAHAPSPVVPARQRPNVGFGVRHRRLLRPRVWSPLGDEARACRDTRASTSALRSTVGDRSAALLVLVARGLPAGYEDWGKAMRNEHSYIHGKGGAGGLASAAPGRQR